MYGFLLDRANLSWTSGEKWRTETGQPFVIFTIEEIQERISCSKPKAIALLKALESKNLIWKDRPKKDGPYHIQVKNFDLGKSKNITCAGKEILPGQVKKFDLNNTENNNTDMNKTERITLLEGQIKTKIQYDYFISNYPKNQVDALVEVMVQTLSSPAKTITVAGVPLDARIVREYLEKAEVLRVQYIFDHMDEQEMPVRAYRPYFLARLCDPEGVVDAFYETLQKQYSF